MKSFEVPASTLEIRVDLLVPCLTLYRQIMRGSGGRAPHVTRDHYIFRVIWRRWKPGPESASNGGMVCKRQDYSGYPEVITPPGHHGAYEELVSTGPRQMVCERQHHSGHLVALNQFQNLQGGYLKFHTYLMVPWAGLDR